MNSATRTIGFIADDITGATDLASALANRGLDVRLVFGGPVAIERGVDAVVVALKIRSVPAQQAQQAALTAANALTSAGVEQLFFKYCSTFDSTAEGNIGPISDALMDLAGATQTLHCPAYPANGRTVYRGHLFVGDELLSESPMKDHPLNPMRESQLQRVLAEQTHNPVELVTLPTIDKGVEAVASRLDQLNPRDVAQHVIADAVHDLDLDILAAAVGAMRVAAGGAPFGAAFAAAALATSGQGHADVNPRATPRPGRTAIVAGSLSRATRAQIQHFDGPRLTLRTDELVDGDSAMRRALAFADATEVASPLLVSTADTTTTGPGEYDSMEAPERSHRIELTMGRIARALVDAGVRRLIVAGGETSGAVADALELRDARLGPDISVGVPWLVDESRGLSIVFKSGNFGGPSFFRDAIDAAEA